MSAAKYSTGPWFVSRRYVVGPKDDTDSQGFGMIVGVADVYGDNRNQDARLIAASPDLYEAAKLALEHAVADELDEWYLALKNAVAKAEGR